MSTAANSAAARQLPTSNPSTPAAETRQDLTTSEQVHRLTRTEAARGYPAILRGVVTCSLPQLHALVLQDATRGIYLDQLDPASVSQPAPGELIEVQGVTDPGEFAPLIHVRRLTRLGAGSLPQPIRPGWDQLINGSLDTQFVEIQGVVTAAGPDNLTLLTHGGRIRAELHAMDGAFTNGGAQKLVNSLIRLRGCLFAQFDSITHQVKVGDIRMFSPALIVDEPAPGDLFVASPKRVSELLQFDPEASALTRVKVAGQIVQERDGEFFLVDGANGLRFTLRDPGAFQAGDLVEVVGFPILTGPSPVLREAVARKTGSRAVPKPMALGADHLFLAEYDATRVRLDAVLLSRSADQQSLELQAGLQRFLAHLDPHASPMKPLPLGSRLRLTGVYCAHGGSRMAGGEVRSFELLLNSPSDILLLARPPFWTLTRLLFLLAALLGVLALALVWIRWLHFKVRARTAQLHNEIREREQAERQQSLAQERARIARDLHDDLGSSLTEISLLATSGPGAVIPAEERSERLGLIAGKSRSIVHALDEIVWAVDPQRDTLASVARYLASYTEEYLAGLNIACRVQIPNSFPDLVVSGEVRHDLFLAVKEALNNAVRHSSPSEIAFALRFLDGRLLISIRDNGAGFDLSARSDGRGISNLRDRLGSLGGNCTLNSAPGSGTTVSFDLPLHVRNASL